MLIVFYSVNIVLNLLYCYVFLSFLNLIFWFCLIGFFSSLRWNKDFDNVYLLLCFEFLFKIVFFIGFLNS